MIFRLKGEAPNGQYATQQVILSKITKYTRTIKSCSLFPRGWVLKENSVKVKVFYGMYSSMLVIGVKSLPQAMKYSHVK